MPNTYSERDTLPEPLRRFYPPQGAKEDNTFPSPFVPVRKKSDDAAYLMHRHPFLLQRLYEACDKLLAAYPKNSFLYDTCPDYLSLRLMRDRLLRENDSLTGDFLQAGCPIEWLNLLTDAVISDLLYRMRASYRNPSGDARTTSVRSVSQS